MKTLLVYTAIVIILLTIVIIKLVIKNRILTKKMKYVDEANLWHKLAFTDDLTGVYNRNAFNLRIEKMSKNTERRLQGIILFDVDDFKMINDTKGHLAGDEILKKVGKNLLEVFPKPDYRVFRIGGDEFSVLSKQASEQEIIEKLITLKNRLENDENISLSKGYSMTHSNLEKAFKYADEMLYADKLAKNSRNHMK